MDAMGSDEIKLHNPEMNPYLHEHEQAQDDHLLMLWLPLC
jgi:hypothetical protein